MLIWLKLETEGIKSHLRHCAITAINSSDFRVSIVRRRSIAGDLIKILAHNELFFFFFFPYPIYVAIIVLESEI